MNVRMVGFLLAAVFSTHVFATAQEPERLLYNGREYSLQTHPLAQYFVKNPEKRPKSTRTRTSLSRGYMATFEMRNKELFLKDIHIFVYSSEGKPEKKSVLSEFLEGKTEMKIDWFSGVLTLPEGKRMDYVHAGYLSTYEKYRLIEIENGNFVREVKMHNEAYKKFFEEYRGTKEYHDAICGCGKPDSISNQTFRDILNRQEFAAFVF